MHCSCNELCADGEYNRKCGFYGNIESTYSGGNVGGDGYLDVIDAYLLHLFINGFTTVDVYAVGDYDLNGVAFEEADIKAIKHAIENHWFSIVFGRSEETRRALPYDSLRENPIVFGFAEGRSSLFITKTKQKITSPNQKIETRYLVGVKRLELPTFWSQMHILWC